MGMDDPVAADAGFAAIGCVVSLVVAVVCGLVGWLIGKGKGQGLLGFILGFFLSFIGLIIISFIGGDSSSRGRPRRAYSHRALRTPGRFRHRSR